MREMSNTQPGVVGFFQWFAREFPNEFNRIKKSKGLAGLTSPVPTFALGALDYSFSSDFMPSLNIGSDVNYSDYSPVPSDVTPSLDVSTSGSGGSSIFSDLMKTVSSAFTTYSAYQQQQNLIKMNAARAVRGLPPLDISAVAPQVKVGLAQPTQNLVIYGLLGIGAVLLIGQMRKR